MKTLPLFMFLIWIIFSGCNSSPKKPEPNAAQKSSFRIDENGDTVKINYRANGSVLSEITIKNGMMNGLSVNYYENGQIQNEINYKDDQKEGRVTWNHENGKLYRESNYIKGEIDGIQKKYYENGKLMAEVPYVKGALQSGTREYNSEGKLKKNYPDIIFETIDKTAFENKYILRISLSKNQKDTKFSRLVENNDKRFTYPLDLRNGCAEIEWPVPKGSDIMEKVKIMAEFQTILDNPVRIDKTYNLAVDNR